MTSTAAKTPAAPVRAGEGRSQSAAEVRVLAVVVVYGRSWDDARAMPMLREWLACRIGGPDAPRLERIVVWDNSPEPLGRPPASESRVEYVHDRTNGGTRAAYVHASAIAPERGATWVLLVDQDTTLPDGYVAALGRAIDRAEGLDALVPRVAHDGRLVSPAVVLPDGRVRPRALEARDAGDAGDARPIPTAIASGTVFRAEALAALMPVPAEYWLDYLDHWLFLRLHATGRRIGPIDCEIPHHLSVQEPRTLPERRFVNILRAERHFMRELGVPTGLRYRLRLAVRGARLVPHRPDLAAHALRAALGRAD